MSSVVEADHVTKVFGPPKEVPRALSMLKQGTARNVVRDRTGWLVACREVAVDTAELGVTPSPHGIWQLEPERRSLVVALREAVGAPHDRLLKGLAARDRAANRFAASPTLAAPGTAGGRSDQDPALTGR